MKKTRIIIIRDLLTAVLLLIACFFIYQYNNYKMIVTDEVNRFECKLTVQDELALGRILSVNRKGQVVKSDNNDYLNITVKYRNKTYRFAEGLMEVKGFLSKKVYAFDESETESLKTISSIADKRYALQTYYENPVEGFTYTRLQHGSDFYLYSNESDIKYKGRDFDEVFAECIRNAYLQPAPYNERGIKADYIAEINTNKTNHRIIMNENQITIDAKYCFNISKDSELMDLMAYLSGNEEYRTELHYWDYTKNMGH